MDLLTLNAWPDLLPFWSLPAMRLWLRRRPHTRTGMASAIRMGWVGKASSRSALGHGRREGVLDPWISKLDIFLLAF